VVAAAASILLSTVRRRATRHLKQILTGEYPHQRAADVAVIVPLYAAIGLLHWCCATG